MRIFKYSLSAIFLFSLVFWAGCTKDFSSVVEESTPVYTVNYIKPLPDTAATKNDTLNLEAGFSSTNKPSSVVVQFSTSSQVQISATLTQTSSISNFFGKAVVGSSLPGGVYDVDYYGLNDDASLTHIGKQYIAIRRWNNSVPVIGDISLADTITVTSSSIITVIQVAVSDSNGLSDITQVLCTVTKPDNTTYQPFTLVDDGSTYDVYANDGIYTFAITLLPTTAKGLYKFDFQAKDKSNGLSIIKSHYLTIK